MDEQRRARYLELLSRKGFATFGHAMYRLESNCPKFTGATLRFEITLDLNQSDFTDNDEVQHINGVVGQFLQTAIKNAAPKQKSAPVFQTTRQAAAAMTLWIFRGREYRPMPMTELRAGDLFHAGDAPEITIWRCNATPDLDQPIEKGALNFLFIDAEDVTNAFAR